MPRRPYTLEEKARMMALDIGKGKPTDVFKAMKKRRRRSRKLKPVSLKAIGRRLGIEAPAAAAAPKPKAAKAASGGGGSREIFCMKCKKKQPAVEVTPSSKVYKTSKGKEVTRKYLVGKCKVCGTRVQVFTS